MHDPRILAVALALAVELHRHEPYVMPCAAGDAAVSWGPLRLVVALQPAEGWQAWWTWRGRPCAHVALGAA